MKSHTSLSVSIAISEPVGPTTSIASIIERAHDERFERVRAAQRDPRTGRMPSRSALARAWFLGCLEAEERRLGIAPPADETAKGESTP